MKIRNCWIRRSCAVLSLVLWASAAGGASGPSYPSKPVRLIVAAPPGGSLDFIARIVAQDLGSSLGQPLVIDNRGGAGGNIAAELAAKAPPDGHTLVLVGPSHVINPSLYRKLSYDAVEDFSFITQIASGSYVIVVPPSVPVKTLKEFVAHAKSKKDGVSYASPGIGQAGHLGMELLKTIARFDAVHVAYKGTGPALIDLMAGRVDVFLSSTSGALPHVKSGKLKVLAVSSLKRSLLLPDVQTVAESGYPGYEVIGVYGLLAPAGTPRTVVSRLYEDMSRSLKLADVRDRLAAGGVDPVGSLPETFKAYVKAEITKWAKVVKQSGATAD
jgi:tripartite-type tricarboxylate transporter receptor subunit TctC